MKITYDESVDILSIRLRGGDYEESEVTRRFIVDFDVQGKPMAVEILEASKLLGQVDHVLLEYARVPQVAEIWKQLFNSSNCSLRFS